MPAGRPRTIEIDPELLHSGALPSEIAELTGCSKYTVLARQRELGIPVRGQGKRGRDRQKRKPGSGLRPREVLAGVPAWMND